METVASSPLILYCPSHERHKPKHHVLANAVACDHVEEPRRLFSIHSAIKEIPGVVILDSEREASDKELEKVHCQKMINFISNTFTSFQKATGEEKEILPEVIGSCARHVFHLPPLIHLQAGFFATDYATPIGKFTGIEARRSAALAIDGAKQLLSKKHRLIYSMCRPPGHHAQYAKYGGYCYFNNAALAAETLKDSGFVTILDIDYHHGNGTQDIFYERKDVAFISIHADPNFEYPFYSGAASEIGAGEGLNFNVNFPLPAHVDYQEYSVALDAAIKKIIEFKTQYLVLSFGIDTAEGDPICTFHNKFDDFHDIGKRLHQLGLPILVVQEGGYAASEILGRSARSLIVGLMGGHQM